MPSSVLNSQIKQPSSSGSDGESDCEGDTIYHAARSFVGVSPTEHEANDVEGSVHSNPPSDSKSFDNVTSQPIDSRFPALPGMSMIDQLAAIDIRPSLPLWASRFLAYRPDGVCRPIWALRWLETSHVPLVVEEYLAACFCTFFAIICVIMVNTMTCFSNLPIPLSLGIAGAMAIVLYASPLSPAAAPRSVILSHLFASVLATLISNHCLDVHEMSPVVIPNEMSLNAIWIWACVSVTLTLLFQKMTKSIHPPAGATALLGIITPAFVKIGWIYVGFVMATVSTMLGVAIVFGNVGRRVYPLYWWTPPK